MARRASRWALREPRGEATGGGVMLRGEEGRCLGEVVGRPLKLPEVFTGVPDGAASAAGDFSRPSAGGGRGERAALRPGDAIAA